MRPHDTTAEAYRIQIEIYRKMSPQERLRRGIELTELSHRLLAEGVRHRHPEYTDDEVRLAAIRLRLPEELFLKVYPHAKHIRP